MTDGKDHYSFIPSFIPNHTIYELGPVPLNNHPAETKSDSTILNFSFKNEHNDGSWLSTILTP
jgi:hypothetical protein